MESDNGKGNQDSIMYCHECGEGVGKDDAYCIECGTDLHSVASSDKPEHSEQYTDVQEQNQAPVQPRKQNTQKQQMLPDVKQYELEKIANKNKTVVILLSIFLTPFGYVMVGKNLLALVNFLTFNYVLLGPIIVPIHNHLIIENAKEDLRKAGVEGY